MSESLRVAATLLLVCFLGCGDDDAADGGGDRDGGLCTDDAVCDDGLFCSGAERCAPEEASADARGCIAGEPPCAETCEEVDRRCEVDCTIDRDGDGALGAPCGADCDDADPRRYPGNTEVCDAEGVDEDCDPDTFGERDGDADGYVDARCCNGSACGLDCDDARGDVHPTEAEECDAIDQDCDGTVDEGVQTRFFRDADGDGHGADAATETIGACLPPPGFSPVADDCDDADASRHPGAFDRCDLGEVDDDCSGVANDPPGGCTCSSGATRTCPLPGACAASTQFCSGGIWGGCGVAPAAETCADGRDEDCDGTVDEGCSCLESHRVCGSDIGACVRGVQACSPTGWGPCVGDRGPTLETCNEVDDDCDGRVDEEVTVSCWRDEDEDGFAWPAATMETHCGACPARTTARPPDAETSRDCDDADARVFPGQPRYYATPRRDGSFDYDCDDVILGEGRERTGCETAPDGTCRWDRWWNTDPARCGAEVGEHVCGQTGLSPCYEAYICMELGCHRLACH